MKSLSCSYRSWTPVELRLFIDSNSHFPFLLPQALFPPDFTVPLQPNSLPLFLPFIGWLFPSPVWICFHCQCLLYPERKVALKINCLVFFSWCLRHLVKISVGKGVRSKDSKSLHWDLDFSTSLEVPSRPMTQGGDCHCHQGKTYLGECPLQSHLSSSLY